MKQVFLNLIHNALQAMPAGGNLRVRTEASQSEDRQWVVIRIADNGLGIRPSDMSRIFEPFFTTCPARRHGLGLSVSTALSGSAARSSRSQPTPAPRLFGAV
jgi:signal transduction histidine kinase